MAALPGRCCSKTAGLAAQGWARTQEQTINVLVWQIRVVAHNQPILVIALTSYTSAIAQQKVLAAGFQKHLSKLMESAQLVETIATLVQRRSV